MRRIAVINHKGGVGKSTVAVGLSVGLARRLRKGRRLLFVDGDSQGNSSSTLLDGKAPNKPTLTQVLLGDAKTWEAIRPSRCPGIDLLPADSSLANCTAWLADEIGREQRLRTALQEIGDPYDWVLIDAPPGVSLVSVNIVHACEELLVPIDLGGYVEMGLQSLQEMVAKIRTHLAHPELAIIGLVLNRVMRNRPSREIEAELRAAYGSLVYSSVIPYAPQVLDAIRHHRTVLEHSPKSPAAEAFESLIAEVLTSHGRKKNRSQARSVRKDVA
jgi:chromosome partitioning protein